MMFLAWSSVVFLALRLIVAMINYLTRPVLSSGCVGDHPLVSVLIPARNEESNIPRLLDDLMKSTYENLEILVYDDDSSDATAAIAGRYCAKDSRIKLIKGIPLPPGWLGKNHACHRLSLYANGEYLLFMDADVRATPELITHALAFLKRHELQLLSLFPVQEMRSFGEMITVPLINWVLLSQLPLWLVSRSRYVSLSAANGQFMLFDGGVYRKLRPHEMVKGDRVEDIRIIRRMKGMEYGCQTLLSGGQVSCRMYKDYSEAINGFSKNVNAFFGDHWLLLIFFSFLTTFGLAFVWLTMPLWLTACYIAGIVLLRCIISMLSRQPVLLNVILMPLQQLSLWLIVIKGGYKYLTRTMTWKGRPINIL